MIAATSNPTPLGHLLSLLTIVIVVLIVLIICVVVVVDVHRHLKYKREGKEVEEATTEQLLRWHEEFMEALVKHVKRNTRKKPSVKALSGILGWPEGKALAVRDQLTDIGLVNATTWMQGRASPGQRWVCESAGHGCR